MVFWPNGCDRHQRERERKLICHLSSLSLIECATHIHVACRLFAILIFLVFLPQYNQWLIFSVFVDLPSHFPSPLTPSPCCLREKLLHQEPCSNVGIGVHLVSLLTGLTHLTTTTRVSMQRSLLWILLHQPPVRETLRWALSLAAHQHTAAAPSLGKTEL